MRGLVLMFGLVCCASCGGEAFSAKAGNSGGASGATGGTGASGGSTATGGTSSGGAAGSGGSGGTGASGGSGGGTGGAAASGGAGGTAGAGGSGGTGGGVGGTGGGVGGTGGSVGGTGGSVGGTGGSGGNLSCDELLSELYTRLQAAKQCCLSCGAEQCAISVPGVCCDETVNSADSPATKSYLELYEVFKAQHCVIPCPAVLCPVPPSYQCMSVGSSATGRCL